MKFRDYYEVLGVDRSATGEQIQKSFRKLARQYHPDLNKEKDAESKFKEINEAYEVLSDPEKRKRYDTLGANFRDGQDFQPPPGWQGAGGGGVRFDFSHAGGGAQDMGSFSDFFEALFGGGGGRSPFGADPSAFEGFGGAHRGREMRPRREAELEVSLEDAMNGATKMVQLSSGDPREGTKKLKIKIPAGTVDGGVIRLAGKDGEDDLYLRIKIAPNARYSVQGSDLVVKLPVSPWEAALGAKVDLQLPEGTIKISVPAGSQTGGRLRVRGKGFTKKEGGRGDVLAELRIVVPTDLSSAERESFEKLASVSSFNPRAAA